MHRDAAFSLEVREAIEQAIASFVEAVAAGDLDRAERALRAVLAMAILDPAGSNVDA